MKPGFANKGPTNPSKDWGSSAHWGYPVEKAGTRRKRLGLALLLAGGLLLVVVTWLLVRFGGNNFHEIEPGTWYRSAQMSPEDLRETIKNHEIRTVLALRGHDPGDDEWYQPEVDACEAEGATHLVAKMASSRLPWRSELQRLFEALDAAEPPLLVHCYKGSDRTGLASVIWLHDFRGKPLKEARNQLNFTPYMHFRYGSAAEMHEFLDRFEAWRDSRPRGQYKIRDWVKLHYFEEKEGREIGPWLDGVTYKP